MAEQWLKLRILTMTVVEGETFKLPEASHIIAAEPVHWAMDGKARWRLVYTAPGELDG